MTEAQKTWWYAKGQDKYGPLTPAELKAAAAKGTISKNDFIWKEGLAEWIAAGSVKGLVPEQAVQPPLPSQRKSVPPVPQTRPPVSNTDFEVLEEQDYSTREDIAPKWKRIFGLIDKAGGAKLPQGKMLTGKERRAVVFNIWAFIFGPVYYLIKGMWRKAITITLLATLINIVIVVLCNAMGVTDIAASFAGSILFAVRANTDYYKKIVHSINGWW